MPAAGAHASAGQVIVHCWSHIEMLANEMDGSLQEFEVDAAVLAVGINGMKKIVAGSRALQQPDFRRVANIGSVDVLAGQCSAAV